MTRARVTIVAIEEQQFLRFLGVCFWPYFYGMQKCMRHAVLSSVACLRGTIFFHVILSRHHFRKKVTERKLRIVMFSTASV